MMIIVKRFRQKKKLFSWLIILKERLWKLPIVYHLQPSLQCIVIFQLKSRFHSLQITRSLISSIKKLIYELPHKLSNELRLTVLKNMQLLGKLQYCVAIDSNCQSPWKGKSLALEFKNYAKAEIKFFWLTQPYVWFLKFFETILNRTVY